jgi:hypothetical protein
MSNGFQTVDFSHLTFPAQMLIDYVRVYQRSDGRMGCDPADRPTASYINRHLDAYNNPNLTVWSATGNAWPVSSSYPKSDWVGADGNVEKSIN